MKHETSFGKFAELWDTKVGEDGSKIEAIKLHITLFFDMIGRLKGKRVYEIACGNGFLARQLVQKGAQVTASDISPELIRIAQTKYKSKGIDYVVRDGTDVKGFAKNSFDIVIINQGIFYIKDLNTLFRGISRILKPRGVLVYNVQHPLLPTFNKAIKKDEVTGKPIDIMHEAQKYTRGYIHHATMKVKKDGVLHTAHYSLYRRPISTYLNAAAKHGLLVTHIAEPPSASRLKGKVKRSQIPSYFVIKSVKA